MSKGIEIIVADDHALLRQTLAAFLREPPLKARMHEAASYDQCLALCASIPKVDIVLIDLFMPPEPGLKGLSGFMEQQPGLKVIVLSGLATQSEVDGAAKLGVSGFLSKDISRELLLKAIEVVLSGGRHFTDALPVSDDRSGFSSNASLTPRQTDVVELMAKGLTNKEIARTLNLSPATVKIHVATTLKALGAQNRTEAVHHAFEAGLIAHHGSHRRV